MLVKWQGEFVSGKGVVFNNYLPAVQNTGYPRTLIGLGEVLEG